MPPLTLADITNVLSVDELAAEVALAAAYEAPVRQLAEKTNRKGAYQFNYPYTELPARAQYGTEFSVPATRKIVPHVVAVAPQILEDSYETGHLAELTSPYELLDLAKKHLATGLARQFTRMYLTEMRGFAMAGLNLPAGNCAITYTPNAGGAAYTNFAVNGTSGGVGATFSALDLEIMVSWARGRYNMGKWVVRDGVKTMPTQKFLYLTSPMQERQFMTGVGTAAPYYAQFGNQDKYYDFVVGSLAGADVVTIDDVEVIQTAAIVGETGGIKVDITNTYMEGFLLGDNALVENCWEEEHIIPHYFTDEANKRMKLSVTWYGNVRLRTGRATTKGNVRCMHVPAV